MFPILDLLKVIVKLEEVFVRLRNYPVFFDSFVKSDAYSEEILIRRIVCFFNISKLASKGDLLLIILWVLKVILVNVDRGGHVHSAKTSKHVVSKGSNDLRVWSIDWVEVWRLVHSHFNALSKRSFLGML